MFKPRLRIPQRLGMARPPPRSLSFVQRQQRRLLNTAPPSLTAKPDGNAIFQQNGIPGFLSPEAFDMGYTQYQTMILDTLSKLTKGTKWEELSPLQILISTAREPSTARLFNHASMAFNSHFFFKGVIKLEGGPNAVMSETLKAELELSFSSVESLKREMLLTANAMFGPGFVWLVKLQDAEYGSRHQFRVLATYLAGSPLPGAHWRRQAKDHNTVGVNDEQLGEHVKEYLDGQAVANRLDPLHGSQKFGSGQRERLPGAVDCIPLLCVNTWEHVWLRDFGLGVGGYGGKMAFLETWWNAVNWGLVQELANLSGREFTK